MRACFAQRKNLEVCSPQIGILVLLYWCYWETMIKVKLLCVPLKEKQKGGLKLYFIYFSLKYDKRLIYSEFLMNCIGKLTGHVSSKSKGLQENAATAFTWEAGKSYWFTVKVTIASTYTHNSEKKKTLTRNKHRIWGGHPAAIILDRLHSPF